MNETASNHPMPQSDLGILARSVTLPETPLSAWFEEVPLGVSGALGPTDHIFVSVMKFAPDALDRILSKTSERTVGSSRISGRAARSWFPPEVKAALGPPEGPSGAIAVKGRKFDAAPFLRPPLSQGYFVTVTGTSFLILVLQTS